MKHPSAIVLLAALFVNVGLAEVFAEVEDDAETARQKKALAHSGAVGGPVEWPVKVRPFLDVPMQNPAICRATDGTYVLTGTVASKPQALPDPARFQNNDGIWLWQSADLKTWTPLGQVWSIERDAAKSPKSAWQLKRRVPNPDCWIAPEGCDYAPPPDQPARGMISPKIHFSRGTYWITYSMNGWGCGLLKSATGKPEGPYEDLGQITPRGGSASLFADDDGAVYWLMDGGWIARMKDDLTGLAETPRLLQAKPDAVLPTSPMPVGRRGAFLFKRKGVYCLTSAEWTGRTGFPVNDTMVATARNVYGPYEYRHLMTAHGGESTVFEGEGGQWYATLSGSDVRAAFRDRPALVPLTWIRQSMYFDAQIVDEYPFKAQHLITERGCWDKARPLFDYHFRDPVFMTLPHQDGYIYFSGSMSDWRLVEELWLFRFKAADTSKVGRGLVPVEGRVVMRLKDLPWLDYKTRLEHGKGQWGYGWTMHFMDGKVCGFDDTLYMTFNLYGLPNREMDKSHDGGKTFPSGSGLIRSTPGDPWGSPWVSLMRHQAEHQLPRKGPDGQFYLGNQKLLPDLTGPAPDAEPFSYHRMMTPRTVDGTRLSSEGIGAGHINDSTHLFGGWVLHGVPTNGRNLLPGVMGHDITYDTAWSFSETGAETGPYPRPVQVPHTGGGWGFRDDKGRLWSCFFGDENTGPWERRLGIIPLKEIKKDGRTVWVDIADEWPED